MSDAYTDLLEHVSGPALYCAGLMHNLCALMLGYGETPESIKTLVSLALDSLADLQENAR